jgi:YD repeat-containing protein
LARNLNLNAQPSSPDASPPTIGKARLSDRERMGLRGPVNTAAHFMGDETESMSEAEYAQDGRLLVWRGRISGGSRVERVYSYDEAGRLIRITSGGADVSDQLYYDEQGRKTLVRTVPPRPDRQSVGTSVEIMFEATEEGDCLIGGGTVTTRYNEGDQPIESLVRDAHGELLTSIIHNYDAGGRLVHETLVRESVEFPDSMFPEQFRGQMPPEHRQIMRAQTKEMLGGHEGFRSTERSYVYDDQGRVTMRRMKMGSFREEVTMTYNEHGDEAGTVMTHSGSIDPRMELEDQRFETRCRYQYDGHGNWTEKTVGGASSTTRCELTYY